MRDPTRSFKDCFQIRCTNYFKKCFQISCTNCFHVSPARPNVPLQTPQIASDVPIQIPQISLQPPQITSDAPLQTPQIASDVSIQTPQISLQPPQIAPDVPFQTPQIASDVELQAPQTPLQAPHIPPDVPPQTPPEEKGSSSSSPLFREKVDRIHLETALKLLKQGLSALDGESTSDQGGDVDPLANKGFSLLENLKTKGQISPGANSEALFEVLGKLLDGLGTIHWIAAGVYFIAVAVKACRDASENTKECREMLGRMVDIMEFLKELWEPEQKHEEKLQRMTVVLIQSAANCCSILYQSWPYRIVFASTTKNDLAKLREKLDYEFQQLHTIISMITKEKVTIIEEQTANQYFQPQPTYPEFAIGLDSKTDEVMRLLQFRGDHKPVRAVCLQGMGGIGKSTLGDAVHAQLQILEKHCKVQLGIMGGKEDLRERERERENEIMKTQEEITEKLFGKGCPKIGSVDAGRELMKSKFGRLNLPVFIFLDNVHSAEQVCDLLPEGDCFPIGSSILVTTKDKYVHDALVNEKKICSHLYEMKRLPENEARDLLYTRIGKEKIQEPSFGEVRAGECEERLLEACGGLPLALKVVGGYLAGRADRLNSRQVWEEVIKKLREGKPLKPGDDAIHSRLMFSVEGLQEEQKSAFLDIVAFYGKGDEKWEDVECYVGRDLLDLLEERALVERSEEYSYFYERSVPRVRAHDVMKGLGERLMRGEQQQRRIRSESDLVDVLEESNNNSTILSEIRGIHLESAFHKQANHRLPATKLQQMHSLRVLRLNTNWEIDGICKRPPKKLQHIELWRGGWPFEGRVSASAIRLIDCDINDNDLESLSDVKLLYILRPLSLTSLAPIPNCVERLILADCWSLTNNANVQGIQRFSSLRYLLISYCRLLQALPDAPSLEELHLYRCPSLHSLPPSYSGLSHLRHLSIRDCKNLEELPDAWGQAKLELEDCPKLRTLPRDFIIQFSLESGSFSLSEFRYFCRRKNLSTIGEPPQSFAGFSFLQELDLSCSENLETLPEDFDFLKSLLFLNLSTCSNLKSLPSSFSKLGSLKVLYMRKCVSLETLPEDLGELHSLSVLDLSGTRIKQLPSSLGDLECLALLDLSDCVKLKGLSTGLSQLSSLQILLLRGCGSMTSAPEDLLQMKSLRYVDIRGCSLHLEEWTERKQSPGPLVVSSRLRKQMEHNSAKTGSVEELLLQCALYDARGEPAQLRDNNIVGLVFHKLDRGNKCPKGSVCFSRIADQELWRAGKKLLWRAGKQPQFIYAPHVSWSHDWRWDDYKRTFEFRLEDVPDDLPDDLPEECLRAVHPLHGTALYAALQEGAYPSQVFVSKNTWFALISLEKGPAQSWFDFFSLLMDADEEIRIVPLELRKGNVSRNSLLVTDKTDYVVSNDGKQVKVAALEGKIVGVYFCSSPPEEAFTRILKDIYQNLRGTEQQAFEVVWIPSHDCPGAEICDCFGGMPWPSLPACNGRSLQTLMFSEKRDPSPALVVFDGEGKMVQKNAVQICIRFGNRAYPFTDERIAGLLEEEEEEERIMLQSHPTLWALLDGSSFLIARDGSKVEVNSLKGKTVGLLYLPYSLSNEKCDSLFVQKLIAKYEESPEQPFEMVAILYGESSEEGFASSVQGMPWLALPFVDASSNARKAKELLEVWQGELARDDANLSRWRRPHSCELLSEEESECLILFDGAGNVITPGEDLVTKLLRECFDLGVPCRSKVYGLPSTICHPSHPHHPMSILVKHRICNLCSTHIQASYSCRKCDYDLCLDRCSQCCWYTTTFEDDLMRA